MYTEGRQARAQLQCAKIDLPARLPPAARRCRLSGHQSAQRCSAARCSAALFVVSLPAQHCLLPAPRRPRRVLSSLARHTSFSALLACAAVAWPVFTACASSPAVMVKVSEAFFCKDFTAGKELLSLHLLRLIWRRCHRLLNDRPHARHFKVSVGQFSSLCAWL